MFLIAHRGNISGPSPLLENSPKYVLDAMEKGFDVEIDVWVINDEIFLGHDNPESLVSREFVLNDKIWCHAKNLDALTALLKLGATCFWHQEDDFTLTSNGFLWTYPGKDLRGSSICVLPEVSSYDDESLLSCSGICSDYVSQYRYLK